MTNERISTRVQCPACRGEGLVPRISLSAEPPPDEPAKTEIERLQKREAQFAAALYAVKEVVAKDSPQWLLADQLARMMLSQPADEPSEQCGSLGERSVIGCELPKGHAGLCDYEDPRADWEKESPPSSADQHRPPCDNPHCCICDGPAQRTNEVQK